MHDSGLNLKVLSIDWDYFIDVDSCERFKSFPDGGNEKLPYSVLDLIWMTLYAQNDSLLSVDIDRGEFKLMSKLLKNANPVKVLSSLMVVDSHMHIYNFVNDTIDRLKERFISLDKIDIDILNIDFHHDCYDIDNIDEHETRELNCGNWVWKLEREFSCNDNNSFRYTWIRREDSDMTCFDKYKQIIKSYKNVYINSKIGLSGIEFKPDIIFVCRSQAWSPPHLDKEFCKFFKKYAKSDKFYNYINEGGIFDNRYNAEFKKNVEQYKFRFIKGMTDLLYDKQNEGG